MRKFLPLFVILLVLFGVTYLLFSSKQSPSNLNVDTRVVVTLAEQNSSGQTGIVTLVPTDNTLSVTLEVTDIGEVPQPAHIHSGTCDKPGPVVVALPFPVNGFSEGEIGTTIGQLKAQVPLIINVHKSEKEASIYTSCGELNL